VVEYTNGVGIYDEKKQQQKIKCGNILWDRWVVTYHNGLSQ